MFKRLIDVTHVAIVHLDLPFRPKFLSIESGFHYFKKEIGQCQLRQG